jgi:hypothetical protein
MQAESEAKRMIKQYFMFAAAVSRPVNLIRRRRQSKHFILRLDSDSVSLSSVLIRFKQSKEDVQIDSWLVC